MSNNRKFDQPESKTALAMPGVTKQPEVLSKEHFTNYLKWTVLTAAESKGCWFHIGVADSTQVPPTLKSVDPTEYKKHFVFAPGEVPFRYVEAVGITLRNFRKMAPSPDTKVVFLINEFGGEFNERMDARMEWPHAWVAPADQAAFAAGSLPLQPRQIKPMTFL